MKQLIYKDLRILGLFSPLILTLAMIVDMVSLQILNLSTRIYIFNTIIIIGWILIALIKCRRFNIDVTKYISKPSDHDVFILKGVIYSIVAKLRHLISKDFPLFYINYMLSSAIISFIMAIHMIKRINDMNFHALYYWVLCLVFSIIFINSVSSGTEG